MPRKKGTPKTGGRKKGTRNKLSLSVKESVLKAFDLMGGLSEFVKWGRDNPGEFYRIYAKLLPTEVKNADGTPFQMILVEKIVAAAEDDSQGG